MAWRALARAELSPAAAITALGALIFVASDSLILVHVFYKPLSFYQEGVMSTYYAAQYCIALSAAEVFAQEGTKPKRR